MIDDLLELTASQRILLPWLPTMHLLLGAAFLFQSPTRSELPTYMVALQVSQGNVQWWAVVFFLVGGFQLWAIMHRSRKIFVRSLILGGWVAIFWGVVVLAAAIRSEQASFVCAVWVLGWYVVHVAAAKSLSEGER